MHPSPTGNCTVRLGEGLEEDDFLVLFPRDGSADTTGKFPCGREVTAFEGKEFKFPATYTCDACTLQWEWEIEAGQIHQCADLVLSDKESMECDGKC